MMKYALRASARIFAFIAAGVGPALAADTYRAPESTGGYKEAPYVQTWTGFYLGVNGGYGWSANNSKVGATGDDNSANGDAPNTTDPGPFFASDPERFEQKGGFAGVQVGYNWQRGRWVYGLEADFQGAGIEGKKTATADADLFGAHTFDVHTTAEAKSRMDWFGTVRGRLGYAFDHTLLYATGGLAYGGVKDRLNLTFNDIGDGNGTFSTTARKEDARAGFVVGGGAEYALSPAWSVKGEYQFMDLGRSKLSATLTDNAGTPQNPDINTGTGSLNADHTYHTVRIGLNYHILPGYEPLK
jgi:outer membrane immunogenic protein